MRNRRHIKSTNPKELGKNLKLKKVKKVVLQRKMITHMVLTSLFIFSFGYYLKNVAKLGTRKKRIVSTNFSYCGDINCNTLFNIFGNPMCSGINHSNCTLYSLDSSILPQINVCSTEGCFNTTCKKSNCTIKNLSVILPPTPTPTPPPPPPPTPNTPANPPSDKQQIVLIIGGITVAAVGGFIVYDYFKKRK